MAIINIDEQLAAKQEAEKEPIQILFRGTTWNFSSSMPAQMPEYFNDGKIVPALLLALDKEQKQEFENLGITLDEVTVLIDAIVKSYGANQGESEASD